MENFRVSGYDQPLYCVEAETLRIVLLLNPQSQLFLFVTESKFVLIRRVLYRGDPLLRAMLSGPPAVGSVRWLAQGEPRQPLLLFSRPDGKVEGCSLGRSTRGQRPSLFEERTRARD